MRPIVLLAACAALLGGCHLPSFISQERLFLEAKAIQAPQHGKKGAPVYALLVLRDWCYGIDPSKVQVDVRVDEKEKRVFFHAYRSWPAKDAGCSGLEESTFREVGVPVSFVPQGLGRYTLEYTNGIPEDQVGAGVNVEE
jgi:hypothetical protein